MLRALASSITGTALALCAIGCGGARGEPEMLDGVYRTTVSARELATIDAPGESPANSGTWTLVLDRGRFAFSRESDEACTGAYGALGLGGHHLMTWTIIDAGSRGHSGVPNEPQDRYGFVWSRYRDVLTLRPAKGSSAGYFAAKPWRRIADTPSVKYLSRHCGPPSGILQPTGAEHAAPSPDAYVDFKGELTRRGATTWTGTGADRQLGRGRVTIEGHVDFRPSTTRARLTFTMHFAKGELRGCSITSILPRPHARYLWQKVSGQITHTSPALLEYHGLPMGPYGVTSTDDLVHMKGGLGSPLPTRRERGTPAGDLC